MADTTLAEVLNQGSGEFKKVERSSGTKIKLDVGQTLTGTYRGGNPFIGKMDKKPNKAHTFVLTEASKVMLKRDGSNRYDDTTLEKGTEVVLFGKTFLNQDLDGLEGKEVRVMRLDDVEVGTEGFRAHEYEVSHR